MYILDTDHLSLLQERSPEALRIRSRMSHYRPDQVFVTMVSFHEQVLGVNVVIQRSRSPSELASGFRLLETVLIDFTRFRVLQFDEPAARKFEELRKVSRRIGTMDLRIASIALSHDTTVLTRNVRDFEQVPDLKFEDWTR